MASPYRPTQQQPALDGRTSRPDDVSDPLLWALAAAVTSAHQPGPDGLCTNLQCRGRSAPCAPARAARHAAQLARHKPAATTPPAADQHPARGRAAVPSGLAGLLTEPEPTAPVDATDDATVFTPFRRPDAAATHQQHQKEERP
ncbi:hypothetical protein OHA21_38350 [Actinoplanes sp. NBC_00393]|jgi:hypothetical protein|uniref:hypothetical protein n=1 Tax=Actinoplanes sp. NBC_00393 TaxID=2975953 RepID=UPI002E1F36AD